MHIWGKARLKFFLVVICAFALVGFLRFARLGQIPQGVTQDEAYYLYDGYSILRTGKDIHGVKYPLDR